MTTAPSPFSAASMKQRRKAVRLLGEGSDAMAEAVETPAGRALLAELQTARAGLDLVEEQPE
jgi:hypothetical protein